MSRRPEVPRVVPAAGCGGTGRELARFGDLTALDAVLIGPVGQRPVSAGRPTVPLEPVPGGLVHGHAGVEPIDRVVAEHLPWLRTRGVRVIVAVRGASTGEVADLASRLRRSLDFEAVVGVEVDLTEHFSTDPQACLKLMSRVREALPRDLPAYAKLGPECPDPVSTARSAIGGGAACLVVSGAVPAGPEGGRLGGPAIGPVTAAAVRRLAQAMDQGRVPTVPLVASGGVYDLASARRMFTAGASGVQVGTALLGDPGLLWRLHDQLRATDLPAEPAPHTHHHESGALDD